MYTTWVFNQLSFCCPSESLDCDVDNAPSKRPTKASSGSQSPHRLFKRYVTSIVFFELIILVRYNMHETSKFGNMQHLIVSSVN